MSHSQSHDGFSVGCVERSSHLEEYTRSRPASAGSRPRSLLNKMANAAAAVQLEEEAEPADTEPWVLEGWGDGPSVSEVAQQAALKLGPWAKNVPTTLVGLGAGGGRRVLSAGTQSRGLLKVSEARRKLGPGPTNAQNDRRSSGPAALSQGAIAALRRAAVQRTLDVGDESDVEPTSYGTPPGPVPTAVAQSRITPAQRAGAGLRQQNVQQIAQNAINAGTARLGRRDAGGGATAAAVHPSASSAQVAVAGADAARGGSPRHRSVSAETYVSGAHAAGTAAATARVPNVSVRGGVSGPVGPGHIAAAAAAAHSHPPLPPQHPHVHLEPLNPSNSSRPVGGRGGASPGDGALPLADRPNGAMGPDMQPVRSASFSSLAAAPLLDQHDHTAPSPASNHAFPGKPSGSQLSISNGALLPSGGAGGPVGPLLLPGLVQAGRRASSFRADTTCLSGWDTDAPAVQHQSQASPAAQGGLNTSLWTGPHAAGSGGSCSGGLQVQPAAGSSGRGSPVPASQGSRRDSSVRAPAVRGGAGGATPTGLLDLSLGPERSSERAGQPAAANPSRSARTAGNGGRSAATEVMGREANFPVPQQDALTEFCASRTELGSAGTSSGSMSCPTPPDGRGHVTANGFVGGAPVAIPMRVTSMTKTSAVGRVS